MVEGEGALIMTPSSSKAMTTISKSEVLIPGGEKSKHYDYYII